MEESITTTKHLRDTNGNVIIPFPQEKINNTKNKQFAGMLISAAFAAVLLLTTCILGISLTRSHAANNEMKAQLANISRTAATAAAGNADGTADNTEIPFIQYYYYEYKL